MKKFKINSKILFVILFHVILIFIISCFLGKHTKYCPWSHILVATTNCVVLDERNGKVLIRHQDSDNIYNSKNYLEIIDDKDSLKFKVPENLLSDSLSVELVPTEKAILVNGKKQEITSLQ